MARIDNLTNFLTDVASAIKTKSNNMANIPAANFDNEILNLPSQGNYQVKTMNITTNGETVISPDQEYDAMSRVVANVQVPMPQLQNKFYEFTSNQNITLLPDSGFDGFTDISVSINVPTEDLNSTVTALENQVNVLTAALENKASGGEVIPHVYVQTTEPVSKDGVWLQTNATVEHYVAENSISTEGTWSSAGDTTNIPYSFYQGSAVAVGTDIYILGGSGGTTNNYKYNTLTDTYTKMADIPYEFYYGSAVAIDTIIYLFGGYGYGTYSYKYDTLTNTYTRLADIPYTSYYSSTVVVGTDIYILGGSDNSTYRTYNYKYDTLTNTYTKLTNIPYSFYQGSAVAVGTDIYILGGYSYSTYNYKYDTLTNTYTKLTNIPYSFYQGGAVSTGTDVYLIGGYGTSNNYKYSTLTGNYEACTNVPYAFYRGSVVIIDTTIYVLGTASSYPTYNRKYSTSSTTYETDNTVVLLNGNTYKVKLFNTSFEEGYQPLYGFADAWFYTLEDGLDTTIPTYYGDGTQWIKFKN